MKYKNSKIIKKQFFQSALQKKSLKTPNTLSFAMGLGLEGKGIQQTDQGRM